MKPHARVLALLGGLNNKAIEEPRNPENTESEQREPVIIFGMARRKCRWRQTGLEKKEQRTKKRMGRERRSKRRRKIEKKV